MANVQTEYVEKHVQWTLGQITRDDDDIRTDSYRTDPASSGTLIGFADPVQRKTGAEATTVTKGASAGTYGIFAGITMRDRTLDPERASSAAGADPVTFARGQMISVLSRGCIAVKVGAAVKAGNGVYYDASDSKFYAAKGAMRLRFMDAAFLSAAAADGIAELRLEGLRVANAVNSDGP